MTFKIYYTNKLCGYEPGIEWIRVVKYEEYKKLRKRFDLLWKQHKTSKRLKAKQKA
jgi:hypothetical protein